MKRTTKGLLSAALSAAMLFSAAPVSGAFGGLFSAPITASAANSSGTWGSNASWTLDSSGKLTVTGSGVVYPYWDTGSGTTYGIKKSDVKSLVVGEGITSLEYYSSNGTNYEQNGFSDCTNLTSVSLPSTLQSVDGSLFFGCTKLATVSLPEKLKSIGGSSFANCSALTGITFPENLESIGERAFFQTGLTSVTTGKYLSTIGNTCFDGCASLSRVTLNEGLFEIGASAFYNCDQLTEVTIPASVTKVGAGAFGNCLRLESLTVLNKDCNITASEGTEKQFVYNRYYSSKYDYTGKVVGYKGSTAETYANAAGWTFEEIFTAPASGTCGTNLKWSFSKSTGELSITGTGAMTNYTASDQTPWYPLNSKYGIRTLSVGSGVTAIGDYAFSGLSLLYFTLPDSVTAIGANAFMSCSSLRSIVLPDSVTAIGTNAFGGCLNANLVRIPAGLTEIADSAFVMVCGTKQLTIPETVTKIGADAFRMTLLDDVYILNPDCEFGNSPTNFTTFLSTGIKCTIHGYPNSTAQEYAEANGIAFVPYYGSTCGDSLLWIFDKSSKTLHIIGEGDMYDFAAFTDSPWYGFADEIRAVDLPGTITSIGDYAFYNEHGLTGVTVPASVTRIGKYAFCNTGLTDIYILNPECELYDEPSTIMTTYKGRYQFDGTIHGYTGSTAEAFALKAQGMSTYGYAFQAIETAPEILVQPASVTGQIGKAAKFTVAAKGENLTYQWQYNKGAGWVNSNGSGAKTDTLSINISAGYNGWQYQCIITNASGQSTISDAVTLKVKTVITSQPADLTAAPGTAAKFTVAASGANLTYQWQYNKGEGWKKSNGSGATTATLSINSSNGYNGYQYRCVIVDANGVKTVSNPATLTVKSLITGQPADVSAVIGATAKFTVQASGTNVSYQWQYNSGDGWKNSNGSGAKTATLSISAKATYNGWKYRCLVKDDATPETPSAEAKLTIKTNITKQPANVTAAVGETAKFTVTATGAGLTYQWQYNSGSGWKNSGSTGATTAELSIYGRTTYNGWKYRCIITDANGVETPSGEATLTVH